MFEEYPDMLTPEELCEMLRMGRNAVYSLLEKGTIKGIRNGRVWKIPKVAVINYIREAVGLKT